MSRVAGAVLVRISARIDRGAQWLIVALAIVNLSQCCDGGKQIPLKNYRFEV